MVVIKSMDFSGAIISFQIITFQVSVLKGPHTALTSVGKFLRDLLLCFQVGLISSIFISYTGETPRHLQANQDSMLYSYSKL